MKPLMTPDACPHIADDQTDTDGDGMGDACDADEGGDGSGDALDRCAAAPGAPASAPAWLALLALVGLRARRRDPDG